MSAGPADPRTFAADRLIEGERLALAVAAGPLALLVTQAGTIADAAAPVKALATLTLLCLSYCCIWQVHIITYATFWLAKERLPLEGRPLPGRRLLDAMGDRGRYSEAGLARLVHRSAYHYSVAYWVGGGAGFLALLALFWS